MPTWLISASLVCALAFGNGMGLFGTVGALAQPPAHPLDTLTQLRTEYPSVMAPTELASLLNRVAWVHRDSPWRLGLLRKDTGNNCPAPQGVKVSCDILVSRSTGNHYDVLIDAGGASTPTWRDIGPIDLTRFVDPTDTGNIPSPPPPPPPPDTELEALRQRVELLEKALAFDDARHALIGEVLAGLHEQVAAAHEQVDTLNRRIADLENVISNMPKPPVRCRATVLGIRVSCQLEYENVVP